MSKKWGGRSTPNLGDCERPINRTAAHGINYQSEPDEYVSNSPNKMPVTTKYIVRKGKTQEVNSTIKLNCPYCHKKIKNMEHHIRVVHPAKSSTKKEAIRKGDERHTDNNSILSQLQKSPMFWWRKFTT